MQTIWRHVLFVHKLNSYKHHMMTIGESQYPIRTKLLYHIYTNLLNMSCARIVSNYFHVTKTKEKLYYWAKRKSKPRGKCALKSICLRMKGSPSRPCLITAQSLMRSHRRWINLLPPSFERFETTRKSCRKSTTAGSGPLAENEGSVFVHTVIRSARNVTNETVGRSVVIMKRMNVPYKMRRLMYVMDVIGSSTVEWRSAYTKV